MAHVDRNCVWRPLQSPLIDPRERRLDPLRGTEPDERGLSDPDESTGAIRWCIGALAALAFLGLLYMAWAWL